MPSEELLRLGKVIPLLNWLSTRRRKRMGSASTAPKILTLALNGGGCSASCPGRFTSRRKASTPRDMTHSTAQQAADY